MIDPNLLANLAAGREVALVSGTNGKTTTTRLTAAALGVLGTVATNSFGANMPTGHTSALARAGHTPYAVLEVDEHYLSVVLAATSPRAVAPLNLSRDQLDRAKEVAMMAQLWRDALSDHPAVHAVANADDPMVVYAAGTAGAVTWVAAGQRWHDDSWVCPECGAHIERTGAHPESGVPDQLTAAHDAAPGTAEELVDPAAVTVAVATAEPDWWCTGCSLRRPQPQCRVDNDTVIGPDGRRHAVRLALPGRVNRANAATALAVAARFGVDPAEAAPHLFEVASIAGRYAQVKRDGR